MLWFAALEAQQLSYDHLDMRSKGRSPRPIPFRSAGSVHLTWCFLHSPIFASMVKPDYPESPEILCLACWIRSKGRMTVDFESRANPKISYQPNLIVLFFDH